MAKRKALPNTPEVASSAAKPSLQAPAAFHCGTAGFANSNWVGNFYPQTLVGSDSDRQLDHYQTQFNTVEINTTFYGLPSESTISRWKKNASDGFLFVLKAPKRVTHDFGKLNPNELEMFLRRTMVLENALGAVLLQCPQTLVVDVPQLEAIRTAVCKVGFSGRLAFEFRNRRTVNDDAVRTFLERNGWALVYHPNSIGRSTVGNSTGGENVPLVEYEPEGLEALANHFKPTADFVYVRLHGTNDGHSSEYTLPQLEAIASQLHKWRVEGLTVFAMILNDLKPAGVSESGTSGCTSASTKMEPWSKWSAMPKNAMQLKVLVHSLAEEEVPKAPKKPRTTLFSFFGKKKA